MFAPVPMLRRIARPARVQACPGLARLVLAAALGLAGAAMAQTALEPEQGGADFKTQGEYSGKAGFDSLGVQVVALGSGQFKAVFYTGGLPGDGWRGLIRSEALGSRTADSATFTGGGYTASVTADGSHCNGKTVTGTAFSLAKTVRKSPAEGTPPPAGALVLFDGTGVSAWKDGTAGMDARKLFKPEGATASAGAITKQTFQDFSLHLEFREPFMPTQRGTQRGNSGIYLQGRYEVQILDSFGSNLATADTMSPKRECGAIWEHFGPKVNMSYPPLSWQTYDILFKAARFDAAGNRTAPAQVTLWWNGRLAHEKQDMLNRTLAGDLEAAAPGSLRFQAYGDSVYYRNIWITEGISAIRPGNGKPSRGTGSAFRESGKVSMVNGRAVGREYRNEQNTDARPAAGHYLFTAPRGGEASTN